MTAAARSIGAASSTLLSAAAFSLSLNLAGAWPLAWIAPVPVLWIAFTARRWYVAAVCCWAAYAIGALNILPAYAGRLPAVVMIAEITIPAACFAISALAGRVAARSAAPLLAALAFAATWTAFDLLLSFGPDGTAVSPAYSQAGAPLLIQGASIAGLWIVTFLLGFVPAGVAAGVAARRRAPVLVALGVFAVNAGLGAARVAGAPSSPVVRVGLGADDSLTDAALRPDGRSALSVVDVHAAAARQLIDRGATLLVFPEKVAILEPAWRGTAVDRIAAIARERHASIVIGFDDREIARRWNVALVLAADGAPPRTYAKRHLVPTVERAFEPGTAPLLVDDRIGIAICKDMDFPRTLRRDAAGHPRLLAVPAWDFGADGWWHARLAIMRGVENGFAVARAAKDGLLTVSDAYGRVLQSKASTSTGMTTLVADVPLGPGATAYRLVGDAFAWACVPIALLTVFAAAAGSRRE